MNYPNIKVSVLRTLAVATVVASSLSACGVLQSEGRASSSQLLGADGKRAAQSVQSQGSVSSSFGGAIIEVFQTDRCSDLSRGGFIWFTDEVVLNDWLSPLGDDLANQVRSKVDFASQGVLLIDYGVAATPGGGIEVLNNQLVMRGSEAIVQIRQSKATSKDKKRAQMVTHPCSLHAMTRDGFKTLVVISDTGDRLTSFSN